MPQRENVFTDFASAINKFASHEMTKMELYERFCDLLQIASDDEKNEKQKSLLRKMKTYGDSMDASDIGFSRSTAGYKGTKEVVVQEKPSSYEMGKMILEGRNIVF